MKFANILKNLFIAMIVLAVFTNARRSQRSKAKVNAAETAKGAEIVNYEASLLIMNNQQQNKYTITIDQDSFNQMDYGIAFTVSEGAITAPGFFSMGGNKFLFNFKEANEFNCLDQATFTNREMYFSIPTPAPGHAGQFIMNDVIFTFPNGWAFGQQVNILAICNKFHDKWNKMRTKREGLRQQIMSTFSHIMLMEQTRAKNIKNKDQLKAENNNIAQTIASLNQTINTQREKIEVVNKNIGVIANKQAAESTNLDRIELDIKNNEAKMALQQEFIDSTNGKISNIRHISQEEIDNEWASFKVNLQKMINLHSSEDTMRSTLEGYLSNAKGNADAIMNTLYTI